MDSQQHQRHDRTSGHENNHVCHKCGWPFPNPHPSAKHRRAHKKICGTIEGYKLLDLEGSAHSNVSEDDRLSDEDHKIPSPKVLEASGYEIENGSGETGELPKKSGDEVFSDAASDFLDGGVGAGTPEHLDGAGESAINVEMIRKNESDKIQSFVCGPIAETIKPPGIATDSIQKQHSETPETTSDRSGNALEFQESSLSFTASSTLGSVLDYQTEDSVPQLNSDRYASGDDLYSVETRKDVSEESKTTNAIDAVVEGPLTFVGQGRDVEREKENYFDSNLLDINISPNEVGGEKAEAMSQLDKTDKTNLEPLPAMPKDGLVKLQEEHSDAFHLKIPESDVATKVEYVEQENASTNTAGTKVDMFEGINYVNFGGLIEKGDVDANLHVLSVPDDIHEVNNPEKMLEDFKDHKVLKLNQSASSELKQAEDNMDYSKGPEESSIALQSNQSEDIAIFSDRHVLEDSVQLEQGTSIAMVKDVPIQEESDLSRIKVEITESQRSDEIRSVSSPEGKESYQMCGDTFQDNFSESVKNVVSDADPVIASGNVGMVQATCSVRLEDHAKTENSALSGDYNSKGAREDDYTENPLSSTESASYGSDIKVTSSTNLEEGEDPSYEKVEIVKDDVIEEPSGDVVALHGKNETGVDSNNDPVKESCLEHLVAIPESAKKFSGDGITGDASDAAAGHVEDETGVDSIDGSREVNFSEHAPESVEKSSKFQANPAANLLEGIDTSDHVKGRFEKLVEHGIESKEGPVNENLLIQQDTKTESAGYLQESQSVAEHVVVGFVEKLPESGHIDLSSVTDLSRVNVNMVSDVPVGTVEHNIEQEELVNVGSAAQCQREVIPSLHTVDNHVRETTLSPLDSESSNQSSTAVEDNSTRELDVVSGLHSVSSQGGSGRQQLGGSVIDASVDSSSQSDSLEGNWGSVSVLSIQSDAQAVVDAETLPPNESQVVTGEKINSNQSKPASEGQHSDKSDMFEPPSFMTLVEPRGGNDQKATASEIQNPQQPKSSSLQAGWFPSITNVVNESQGRKKNEEIIAKVTNWSAGKQHTPLKSLLGEATLETRAKSPKCKENVAPVVQKDEKAATVNSILAPESPLGHAANREIGQEWNSPARYPTEIKREKKKPKSRPYWVQFVCCSSVH